MKSILKGFSTPARRASSSIISVFTTLPQLFFTVVYYEWVSLPKTQTQMEECFNFDKNDVPDIKNIIRNISLVLVNSHYTIGYIKPELPNVVNIAGLHQPSLEPLREVYLNTKIL